MNTRRNLAAAVIALVASAAALLAAAAPTIKTERKPWGTDYTLVASDGPGDVTLVSVRPKCTKYASQMANMYSDDEYGVGVRAWDIRDEMVQSGGELKVIVKGGRPGATASVIEGPRETLAERFAAAGRAHGAPINLHGGPFAGADEDTRLSYMFAEVTSKSCEDYIELARRGGQGVLHFHGWWSSLGHYPVNTKYFPGGIADLTAAAAKVHAAGLKVGMHTLSGCIDFKDRCLSTDAVRDLQHVARYTLAADIAEDATELTVKEKPVSSHDRVMTYSGNGNVVRIGSELIQYDDFTTEPPYVFKGLKRRWCGSRGGAHKAGEAVDYLRQRYLSFYPEPGTALGDEVAEAIAGVFNACKGDQIYFDGSEGMGTRYNIDWMRHRLFRAIGRDILVEASHIGLHNWYFHSRLNAWDYPSWNLNAFNDLHAAINSTVRKADLLVPQMGWWAPLTARPLARAHLREEIEYVAGKTAALDASFAISGVEEAFGPPPWLRLDQLTILGWYEGMRTAHSFSPDALAKLGVPGDEYRLRADADGVWRLQRAFRNIHRVSGEGTTRWEVSSRAAAPAALRVEALFGADEGRDDVVLLPAGKFPKKTWAFPYLDAKDRGAFVFDVKGDGSGRTLVFTVKSPREFTAATSEHRVKIDFTGWRRITVLARERDAAPNAPLPLRYVIYRTALKLDHISEVSFAWDGGENAPPLEIGEVRACLVKKQSADRPVLAVGGREIEVPFSLEPDESAELEGGWWTKYSATGEPMRREHGPDVALAAGATSVEWRSPARAEVIVTALGEKSDALAAGADMPEFSFMRPQPYAPARGFSSLAPMPVEPGAMRQVRLELMGAIDRPAVTVAGKTVTFPVTMKPGDRLLCRDGRRWLLRDAKRKTLAEGALSEPLPVISAPAEAAISCAKPDAADVRVLLSTRRVAAPRGLKIVQLDLARQMETCSFVSNYIDRVSALGYDTLQLYLEGRVATKTFSLPEGERYTADQMRGIVAHAASRGMTVVPVVSLLGHAEQFFRYPGQDEYLEKGGECVRLGNGRDTFCLSNPATREFLSRYIADLCEIFPGPYFHAGFDEAWNSGTCPRCREKEKRDELFAECVLFAHDLLGRHGKRMWMWDDFFSFHPKAFEKMPKDIVMCHWNYEEDVSDRGTRINFAGRRREDVLAKYAALGYDAIPCCWFRTHLNVVQLASYARRNKTFGFMVTQWEDLIDGFHGGVFPCVVATSLLLDEPERYLTEDVFTEASRRIFPSLSETEHMAVSSLLRSRADELAISVLRASALTPGAGEVDPDAMSERALLDDVVMRGETAAAKARLERAEALLSDPRRTKAEVKAAAASLRPLAANLRRLAERRSRQFALWRPGCTPLKVAEPLLKKAEKAEALAAAAATAAPDEKRLEMELTLVDRYGIPRWNVFGRFGGKWREIASGCWKPSEGQHPAFTARTTFKSETMPDALRLDYHGYGDALLRFVSVEDRSSRVVPAKVTATSGDVENPECILDDDYSAVRFGKFGFLEAFYDKAKQEKVSSLTVEMK